MALSTDMKSPVFPKELNKATLRKGDFKSHEEYSCLRFEDGHLMGEQAEYLVLHQVQFQGVHLSDSLFYSPSLADIRLTECSLANANCERMIAHRTEFIDCQLVGLNATEGHLQDVLFRACDVQLVRFRFCTFKSVTFDGCNLKGANFQGADLSGVRFKRCDLSEAEMSQAKLTGTDFRTSEIEGLRVGAEEVVGAVVDHFQAVYMASLLGLVVKSDDEE